MGFWDDLVNNTVELLSDGCCAIGLHSWSTWSLSFSSDPCMHKRHCERPRCTVKDSKIIHKYGEWKYINDTSCKIERLCERCSHSEKSMSNHTFSEWEDDSLPKSCKQTRHCTRCKEEEERFAHLWTVWKFARPNSCTQIRYCRRCPASETSFSFQHGHKWGEWQDLSNGRQRFCHQCSQEEFQPYQKQLQ